MTYLGAGKDRHIETCLTRQVESGSANGFERYELMGDLPDFNFVDIDLSTTLLGRRLNLPIMISSLTGGGRQSERINRNLAEAAQSLGLAMTLGSQRIMLEHPETRSSFQVRRWAPDILLLADLGLVHLNHGLTVEKCREAVETVGADGLALYVNPMHEAIQRNGMLDFTGLGQGVILSCSGEGGWLRILCGGTAKASAVPACRAGRRGDGGHRLGTGRG